MVDEYVLKIPDLGQVCLMRLLIAVRDVPGPNKVGYSCQNKGHQRELSNKQASLPLCVVSWANSKKLRLI